MQTRFSVSIISFHDVVLSRVWGDSRLNILEINIVSLVLLFPSVTLAGFDWGAGKCSDSGQFSQAIAHRKSVDVGVIPAGIIDLRIDLLAKNDVDIQLYDHTTGKKIIGWPKGILSGEGKQTTTYHQVRYTWSGYKGQNGKAGHEYISIQGATNKPLLMKAFGYQAGDASVNYLWRGKQGCVDAPTANGSGSFQQYIKQRAVVKVGNLVKGLRDVVIQLQSKQDVDIQLIDSSNQQKVVQWPDGLLKGETAGTIQYKGLSINWSGYGGDGTGAGNERIEIVGLLPNDFALSLFGYAAGEATVNYRWGKVAEDPWSEYYESAKGLTGVALKQALNEIISGHTRLSYRQVWDALKDTDEDPNNNRHVILLYKQASQPKNENGGKADEWNREHVWAKSHGGFGTSPGPGTDVHHLRPTDVTVNRSRSNLDFDMGGRIVEEAPKNRMDRDSWEPDDTVKGDIARMLFYMVVRYEGGDGFPDLELVEQGSTRGAKLGRLSVLKQWHQQDPVSDWERQRNDKIYANWQGNRNPFIDHPEWVNQIW